MLPTLTTHPALCDPETLLAISFAEGHGSYYKQALTLAKGAARYIEHEGMHCAAFGKYIEGATRALAILDFIGQTRGCHIYTGSPMLWGSGRVRGVLRCYLGALNFGGIEKWCHVSQGGVLELVAGLPIRTLPCKKIVGYYAGHQLQWEDTPEEYRAAAIEAGVEWCPCWKAIISQSVSESFTPCPPELPPHSPKYIR